MTALTSCRLTVGEDPAVAFSPLGFATPLSVETRSWPCPSGVFACKPVLIGSELQHFPAPAALLFPIHAERQSADLSEGMPSQASGGSSRYRAQAPRLSPAVRPPRPPGPTPAKRFQDSSTVARCGAGFLPATQSPCDRLPAPRLVCPPIPGSIQDYFPPWLRAGPNPTQLETLFGTPAADFSSNTRGPGNTTNP